MVRGLRRREPGSTAIGGGECHPIPTGDALMLTFILYLIVVGIVAGYLARLLVPGRDPMSFVQTAVLGIVGSFIGGFLGYVIFGEDFDEGALQPAGFVGSIIGAIIALLIYRAVTGSRARRI